VSGNPNLAPAGDNGVASDDVLDVSQTAWTDAQRATLGDAGVNVIRSVGGSIELYGFRTLVSPVSDANWIQLTNSRLHMAIVAQCQAVGELFVFDQIDGQGRKFAEFAGALTGVLLPYHLSGALYGDSPGDAFDVDVGPAVNTPTTIAAGVLKAVIALTMSPFAEQVRIEIAKEVVA
jgi:phage tail sheath protein FI